MVPKRKFHSAFGAQRFRKHSEGRLIRDVVVDVLRVEPHRIGYVVGIGAEPQILALRDPERLVDARIHAEDAWSAKIVSLSGFPDKGKPEGGGCGHTIRKDIGAWSR